MLICASLIPLGSLPAQTVIDVPPQAAPHDVTENEVLNLLPAATWAMISPPNRARSSTFWRLDWPQLQAGDTTLHSPLTWLLTGNPPRPLPIVEPVTIHLNDGEVGDDFRLWRGTTLNITGGQLGEHGDADSESAINMSGGAIGRFFGLDYGAKMNISGGALGDYSLTQSRSNLHVSGGNIGEHFLAMGEVAISGGSFGHNAFFTGTTTISGGRFDEAFGVGHGASLNLIGSEFLLDGVPIAGLVVDGPAWQLDTRHATLSVTFLDGNRRDFDLDPDVLAQTTDYFATDANVTLTLVAIPELGGMGLCLLGLWLLAVADRRRTSC